jgi:hypothetical protein
MHPKLKSFLQCIVSNYSGGNFDPRWTCKFQYNGQISQLERTWNNWAYIRACFLRGPWWSWDSNGSCQDEP